MNNQRRNITIASCCAISAVLGTIHAFSVFTAQWETIPGADRASVSLAYSIALVSLTMSVLFGHQLYQRLSPVTVFTIVGILAAFGLLLAAESTSLVSLYLSYGLVFGGANGLGYGYALQLSGQAAPDKRSLAMGMVTAFYAVGATAAPILFTFLIDRGGNSLALQAMSAIALTVSLSAAGLVHWTQARYVGESASAVQTLSASQKHARFILWLGYGCAVTAGLMVIGHAYGIAISMNLSAASATLATTLVVFGNMLGGFSAAYYADRFSSRLLLSWLPLLSAAALVLLVWPMESAKLLVFTGLAIVGYCYGAVIALYPVAVVDVFGALAAPRIYGQIFTAWGLAGLLGPWLTGWLYDQTNSYTLPLVFALSLSVASVAVIRFFLRIKHGCAKS